MQYLEPIHTEPLTQVSVAGTFSTSLPQIVYFYIRQVKMHHGHWIWHTFTESSSDSYLIRGVEDVDPGPGPNLNSKGEMHSIV